MTEIGFIRKRENIERYAMRGVYSIEREKWQYIERLSSIWRYYLHWIISGSILQSEQMARVQSDQSHFGRPSHFQSRSPGASRARTLRRLRSANRSQRMWSLPMLCRYFEESFYSWMLLYRTETEGRPARSSNFGDHLRGCSQVAMSRMISRIGDTHIPWTLARSHFRVISITAWVICYLY